MIGDLIASFLEEGIFYQHAQRRLHLSTFDCSSSRNADAACGTGTANNKGFAHEQTQKTGAYCHRDDRNSEGDAFRVGCHENESAETISRHSPEMISKMREKVLAALPMQLLAEIENVKSTPPIHHFGHGVEHAALDAVPSSLSASCSAADVLTEGINVASGGTSDRREHPPKSLFKLMSQTGPTSTEGEFKELCGEVSDSQREEAEDCTTATVDAFHFSNSSTPRESKAVATVCDPDEKDSGKDNLNHNQKDQLVKNVISINQNMLERFYDEKRSVIDSFWRRQTLDIGASLVFLRTLRSPNDQEALEAASALLQGQGLDYDGFYGYTHGGGEAGEDDTYEQRGQREGDYAAAYARDESPTHRRLSQSQSAFGGISYPAASLMNRRDVTEPLSALPQEVQEPKDKISVHETHAQPVGHFLDSRVDRDGALHDINVDINGGCGRQKEALVDNSDPLAVLAPLTCPSKVDGDTCTNTSTTATTEATADRHQRMTLPSVTTAACGGGGGGDEGMDTIRGTAPPAVNTYPPPPPWLCSSSTSSPPIFNLTTRQGDDGNVRETAEADRIVKQMHEGTSKPRPKEDLNKPTSTQWQEGTNGSEIGPTPIEPPAKALAIERYCWIPDVPAEEILSSIPPEALPLYAYEPPPLSLAEYINHLVSLMPCEMECFVLALALVLDAARVDEEDQEEVVKEAATDKETGYSDGCCPLDHGSENIAHKIKIAADGTVSHELAAYDGANENDVFAEPATSCHPAESIRKDGSSSAAAMPTNLPIDEEEQSHQLATAQPNLMSSMGTSFGLHNESNASSAHVGHAGYPSTTQPQPFSFPLEEGASRRPQGDDDYVTSTATTPQTTHSTSFAGGMGEATDARLSINGRPSSLMIPPSAVPYTNISTTTVAAVVVGQPSQQQQKQMSFYYSPRGGSTVATPARRKPGSVVYSSSLTAVVSVNGVASIGGGGGKADGVKGLSRAYSFSTSSPLTAAAHLSFANVPPQTHVTAAMSTNEYESAMGSLQQSDARLAVVPSPVGFAADQLAVANSISCSSSPKAAALLALGGGGGSGFIASPKRRASLATSVAATLMRNTTRSKVQSYSLVSQPHAPQGGGLASSRSYVLSPMPPFAAALSFSSVQHYHQQSKNSIQQQQQSQPPPLTMPPPSVPFSGGAYAARAAAAAAALTATTSSFVAKPQQCVVASPTTTAVSASLRYASLAAAPSYLGWTDTGTTAPSLTATSGASPSQSSMMMLAPSALLEGASFELERSFGSKQNTVNVTNNNNTGKTVANFANVGSSFSSSSSPMNLYQPSFPSIKGMMVRGQGQDDPFSSALLCRRTSFAAPTTNNGTPSSSASAGFSKSAPDKKHVSSLHVQSQRRASASLLHRARVSSQPLTHTIMLANSSGRSSPAAGGGGGARSAHQHQPQHQLLRSLPVTPTTVLSFPQCVGASFGDACPEGGMGAFTTNNTSMSTSMLVGAMATVDAGGGGNNGVSFTGVGGPSPASSSYRSFRVGSKIIDKPLGPEHPQSHHWQQRNQLSRQSSGSTCSGRVQAKTEKTNESAAHQQHVALIDAADNAMDAVTFGEGAAMFTPAAPAATLSPKAMFNSLDEGGSSSSGVTQNGPLANRGRSGTVANTEERGEGGGLHGDVMNRKGGTVNGSWALGEGRGVASAEEVTTVLPHLSSYPPVRMGLDPPAIPTIMCASDGHEDYDQMRHPKPQQHHDLFDLLPQQHSHHSYNFSSSSHSSHRPPLLGYPTPNPAFTASITTTATATCTAPNTLAPTPEMSAQHTSTCIFENASLATPAGYKPSTQNQPFLCFGSDDSEHVGVHCELELELGLGVGTREPSALPPHPLVSFITSDDDTKGCEGLEFGGCDDACGGLLGRPETENGRHKQLDLQETPHDDEHRRDDPMLIAETDQDAVISRAPASATIRRRRKRVGSSSASPPALSKSFVSEASESFGIGQHLKSRRSGGANSLGCGSSTALYAKSRPDAISTTTVGAHSSLLLLSASLSVSVSHVEMYPAPHPQSASNINSNTANGTNRNTATSFVGKIFSSATTTGKESDGTAAGATSALAVGKTSSQLGHEDEEEESLQNNSEQNNYQQKQKKTEVACEVPKTPVQRDTSSEEGGASSLQNNDSLIIGSAMRLANRKDDEPYQLTQRHCHYAGGLTPYSYQPLSSSLPVPIPDPSSPQSTRYDPTHLLAEADGCLPPMTLGPRAYDENSADTAQMPAVVEAAPPPVHYPHDESLGGAADVNVVNVHGHGAYGSTVQRLFVERESEQTHPLGLKGIERPPTAKLIKRGNEVQTESDDDADGGPNDVKQYPFVPSPQTHQQQQYPLQQSDYSGVASSSSNPTIAGTRGAPQLPFIIDNAFGAFFDEDEFEEEATSTISLVEGEEGEETREDEAEDFVAEEKEADAHAPFNFKKKSLSRQSNDREGSQERIEGVQELQMTGVWEEATVADEDNEERTQPNQKKLLSLKTTTTGPRTMTNSASTATNKNEATNTHSYLLVCTRSIHRIFLAALLTCIKLRHDKGGRMSFYSAIGGLAPSDLRAMEIAFLGVLNFDARISTSYYLDVLYSLRQHCTYLVYEKQEDWAAAAWGNLFSGLPLPSEESLIAEAEAMNSNAAQQRWKQLRAEHEKQREALEAYKTLVRIGQWPGAAALLALEEEGKEKGGHPHHITDSSNTVGVHVGAGAFPSSDEEGRVIFQPPTRQERACDTLSQNADGHAKGHVGTDVAPPLSPSPPAPGSHAGVESSQPSLSSKTIAGGEEVATVGDGMPSSTGSSSAAAYSPPPSPNGGGGGGGISTATDDAKTSISSTFLSPNSQEDTVGCEREKKTSEVVKTAIIKSSVAKNNEEGLAH